MKMYIIVKESIPDNLVPVITAHASLACFLKYEQDEEMRRWINSIFKKTVCKVTEVEFEKARQVEKNVLLTESSLNNQEVCLAFAPRKEYPKFFKYFRLWSPQASIY
jgi:peptidyl-tRNA hydrolase